MKSGLGLAGKATAVIGIVLALAAASTLIGGCGPVTNNYYDQHLPALQPGRTTEADAQQMLGGLPESYTNQPDGSYIAVWRHIEPRFMQPARISRVEILFDRSKVMSKLVGTEHTVEQDKRITTVR